MKLTRYIKEFDIDKNKKLIINTISGAVDVIDTELYEELQKGTFENIHSEIYDQLQRRGYLVKSEQDDINKLKVLVECQSKMDLGTFIICVTYMCNLNCSYCFETSEVKRNKKILNISDVDKIFQAIDILKKERKFSRVSVLLYGGEPFLPKAKETVSYILKRAKENGYWIQSITNGTRLVEYKALLSEYRDIIRNIQITLDGDEIYHNKTRKYHNGEGSFSDIVKGIDLCQELDIPINLRVNVGKNNIEGLEKLLSFVGEKRWWTSKNFVCQLAPITDHFCTHLVDEWLPEHIILEKLSIILDKYRNVNIRLGTDMEKRISILKSLLNGKKNKTLTCIPCSAALRNYFVFGVEGNIYACPETVGIVEQSIGTFLPELNIIGEKEAVWRRNVTNIEKCSNCNIAGICGGGCTWSAIATNGSEFVEAQCNYADETICTYFKINAERFRKHITN